MKSYAETETPSEAPSLPSRERGLKFGNFDRHNGNWGVAPLAGAWIEIEKEKISIQQQLGRSPRGSVD